MNSLLPIPEDGFFQTGREKSQGLLKKLSARHHRLAQALGEGLPPGEAAILCGYVASRVSILQADPSFKELVEFYKAQRAATFAATGKKLAEVADTAIEILQDRLETNPEEFSNGQLLSVITVAADRTGLGPQSTQRNISVSVTGEQLAELKTRVLNSQTGSVKLIPAQPIEGSKASAGTQAPTEAEVSPSAEGT